MTDRVAVVVGIVSELVDVARPRHEAHVVVADDVERRVAGRLHPRRVDVVQLLGVVDLVEAVDDRLVVDRHVPLEHLVQDHVLHPEPAEVGGDLGADRVDQRRRGVGSGEVDPHPAAPLVGGDRRRAHAVEIGGIEVVTIGHTDDEARRVVHPAVIRAREPLGAAPDEFTDECRAAVLAHVVERGERAVSLPSDDDGLTVAFERQPVARAGELVRAAGDDPVRAEHPLALQLESHRIRVDVARHRARPVVRHELHARAQPDRDIASCRYVHHVDLTRFAHSGRLRCTSGGTGHPKPHANGVDGASDVYF